MQNRMKAKGVMKIVVDNSFDILFRNASFSTNDYSGLFDSYVYC